MDGQLDSVLDIIPSEIPKALALVTEIKDQLISSLKLSDSLSQRVKDSESTHKGISFLEAKYHTMLSYLVNLTHIIMMKLDGEKIDGSETIKRLVEYRVILERMRPIDQKLKYQIDKLLRIVSSGTVDTNDPLHFRANPDNMMSKLQDEESSDSEDEEKQKLKEKSKGIYVPPKLAAVHYDGDELGEDKEKQRLNRARKKALSSSIMEDLRNEYYDGPQEIKEHVDIEKNNVEKNAKHRLQYEEDNFVRLSLSKKEQNARKKVSTISSLGSIAKFEDLSVLEGGNVENVAMPKKRTKSKGSFKSKKGSKKRKRFH